MASDISADTYIGTSFARITLGSSDVLTQVKLHRTTRWVGVRFITNDGKVAKTGTDGGAIGSAYGTATANGWALFPWTSQELYLASATGSTVVEVAQYSERP